MSDEGYAHNITIRKIDENPAHTRCAMWFHGGKVGELCFTNEEFTLFMQILKGGTSLINAAMLPERWSTDGVIITIKEPLVEKEVQE